MTRLAVPILILLLMLFAGAVWLLYAYLDLPQMAGSPPADAAIDLRAAGTCPAPAQRSAPRRPRPATSKATFDVARIDPKGTSVFAGRAEPGSTVTIMGDGKPVGTAKADENGEWTFATEHPFASADPKLALLGQVRRTDQGRRGGQQPRSPAAWRRAKPPRSRRSTSRRTPSPRTS